MNLYDVIRRPIVTEKAENLREQNVYAFEIDSNANKTLVKQAIRKIYNVTPEGVNIINTRPKKKRNRLGYGYKPGMKKAYVFLNAKDKIEIFEAP